MTRYFCFECMEWKDESLFNISLIKEDYVDQPCKDCVNKKKGGKR